eukprot:scaffold1724_cov341-Pavlova_lutheri.AAC.72
MKSECMDDFCAFNLCCVASIIRHDAMSSLLRKLGLPTPSPMCGWAKLPTLLLRSMRKMAVYCTAFCTWSLVKRHALDFGRIGDLGALDCFAQVLCLPNPSCREIEYENQDGHLPTKVDAATFFQTESECDEPTNLHTTH